MKQVAKRVLRVLKIRTLCDALGREVKRRNQAEERQQEADAYENVRECTEKAKVKPCFCHVEIVVRTRSIAHDRRFVPGRVRLDQRVTEFEPCMTQQAAPGDRILYDVEFTRKTLAVPSSTHDDGLAPQRPADREHVSEKEDDGERG